MKIVRNLLIAITAMLLVSCHQGDQSAKNDIPEAEKKLRDDISKNPDSLLLTENLIQYFRENGNYGTALSEIDHAIQKDTTNARWWFIKATLLSENQDTTKAIAAWEKLIQLDPQPINLISLGVLYAYAGNPMALGITDLLLHMPDAKAASQAVFIKGLYYKNIKDFEAAALLFDQCIQIDYTNIYAYREKASGLYELGRYEEAIKLLEVAIKVNKNNEEIYYWLGRCLEKTNNKDLAIKSYQAALELVPDYVEAKDAMAKLGVQH